MDEFADKLKPFFSQFPLREYKRGEIILRPDTSPKGVYLIRSGFVKLYSISLDGDELIRLILGPGDLFPIRWTIDLEGINYYLEPVTPVTCWYAPRQMFLDYVQKDPKLTANLMSYLVQRMGTLYKRMEFLVFGDAYQKITSILVFLANRFGEVVNGNELMIELPLTQKDIGSLVGVVRETTNLILEELRHKELIECREHHVIIKDYKRLEQEAEIEAEI